MSKLSGLVCSRSLVLAYTLSLILQSPYEAYSITNITMSRSSDINQEPPFGMNDLFESLRTISKGPLTASFEDDEGGFSPFPQEPLLDEEDMKSLELNFREHNKLRPQLEDLLKMLSQKDADGENSNMSLKMSASDRDTIITNLQKAQSDVESIQGQLSEMLNKGFFSNELEHHAKILHKLSVSAVADLLPKEIKEVFDRNKGQESRITPIENEIEIMSSADNKLPPISNLTKETHMQPAKSVQRKSVSKKPHEKHSPRPMREPDYLPYDQDECILCEYYHVFGRHPVNLMKAYEKRLKEEATMKSNLENRTRRKKRHQRKK